MISRLSRRRPPRAVFTGIVLAGLGLFLAWVLWTVNDLAGKVDATRAERDALVAQVRALGEKPVVEAEPGEPGPAGKAGPAPSAQQVAVAVAAYCSEHDDCQGRTGVAGVQGEKGQRGPAPSPAQVAAAVRAYCDTKGQCRGPEGEQGDRGEKGDSVTGPQGPAGPQGPQGDPPSDAQVAAAVASYCDARDQCRGPRGPTGPDGKDGRGIASGPDFVRNESGECVARTTYTDGTTYDSPAGDSACRPPANPLVR